MAIGSYSTQAAAEAAAAAGSIDPFEMAFAGRGLEVLAWDDGSYSVRGSCGWDVGTEGPSIIGGQRHTYRVVAQIAA